MHTWTKYKHSKPHNDDFKACQLGSSVRAHCIKAPNFSLPIDRNNKLAVARRFYHNELSKTHNRSMTLLIYLPSLPPSRYFKGLIHMNNVHTSPPSSTFLKLPPSKDIKFPPCTLPSRIMNPELFARLPAPIDADEENGDFKETEIKINHVIWNICSETCAY